MRTIIITTIVICVVSPLLGHTTLATSNLESDMSLVAFFPKFVCDRHPSDIPRRPKSIRLYTTNLNQIVHLNS